MSIYKTPLWILDLKSRDKAIIESNHHILGARHHNLKEHGKHNFITNALLAPNEKKLII